jgi:hypothetical protein
MNDELADSAPQCIIHHSSFIIYGMTLTLTVFDSLPVEFFT